MYPPHARFILAQHSKSTHRGLSNPSFQSSFSLFPSMKKFANRFIPNAIWQQLGQLRRHWLTRKDPQRSTRDVFTRIYKHRIWGSHSDDAITSGTGSRDSHVVDPYIDAVLTWAHDHGGDQKTALDMGCGDFHVGRRIFPAFARYIAADIVPFLIENHQQNHQADRLEFRCIDAIEEPLPAEADVVFFRQVLQHLSNDQISAIVPKLREFADLIITEHVPAASSDVRYNLDKPHGSGIRLGEKSGIDLELPPFNLAPSSSHVLLEVPATNHPERDGIIRTTWYHFKSPSMAG
jgi:hypothetical protein